MAIIKFLTLQSQPRQRCTAVKANSTEVILFANSTSLNEI